jgi:hypothetical protein
MWKNSRVGSDRNWIWNSQGEIATSVGTNGLIVRFADLRGTGKTDYLNVILWSSRVKQWLNSCGADSGTRSTATWSVPTPTASSGTSTSSSPRSNRSSKSSAKAL